MISVVLFRQNLRVIDNRALVAAAAHGDPVLPVAVWDTKRHERPWCGWASMGSHREQFLVEALTDLNQQLHGNLCVAAGTMADVVSHLAQHLPAMRLITNAVPGQYEAEELQAIARICDAHGHEVSVMNDTTLLDDIQPELVPNGFTKFRQHVEKRVKVAAPDKAPTNLNFANIPATITQAQLPAAQHQAPIMRGGETAAWQHLDEYMWQTNAIAHYKKTRNRLIGRHVSAKVSMALAHGCVSARSIYAEIKRYEKQVQRNDSTYWLFFELLWRDFFHYQCAKHHKHWYQHGGFLQPGIANPPVDNAKCQAWITGTTENAFVNANMLELVQTGYMSNRGRQNVASYLIHDLGQDWRWGAAAFEHYLIDADVASNIGNWMYIAGVGNSNQPRVFNVPEQAKRYDASGAFVNHWLQGKLF